MPLPYIIELTSKSVGGIKGSSQVYGKSNAILGYSFEHRVHVPRDLPENGETGLRFHDPLIICKEIDKTTPLLYQHLTSEGLFSEIILRFYKADPRGKEINYHTLILNDAIITDISPEMRLTFLEENDSFRDMEYVSFAYKSIRWIDEIGLTETSDSTQLLHDPMEECELISGGVIASAFDGSGTLNFMFVDHDTTEVIRGVKAQVTYPNGDTQHALSSQNGCFSMHDVEKGSYSLSGFNDKPPAAWRENCYSLVKITQPTSKEIAQIKPSQQEGTQSRHHSAFKYFCNIKEHRVKKGDLFSDVAKSHGFSMEELAFFNWGTKEKQKIPEQQKMRFECGELSSTGNEYFLNEGTIYIPGSILKKGLSTDVQHVVYLKTTGQRDIKATVLTSANHPVPLVDTTLTLGDKSTVTATTDEEGVALFSGIPADLKGEVTYANEEDLIAKSLAANIHGAIERIDMESLLGLMQSAVDFKTVGQAYQTNYNAELTEAMRDAFNTETQKDAVNFLLLKTGLMNDSKVKLYEETHPA